VPEKNSERPLNLPPLNAMYCLYCAIRAKKSWKEQHDNGVEEQDILVTPPELAYTWQPVLQSGVVVAVPVCLADLIIPTEASGLFKGAQQGLIT
jgi:hypothetical protein